ncbi:MAG TPA: Do family serine endopeptidase [Candidatus Cloacimonas sp.]|jgi:serine protease Do|nr:Do family serine endopeptidase [Candidatus Cloacimonas sp.]MDD2249823.1 Do family serine endopeptidase [Candidatus Cloacimonadota bacterium]MDD3733582.1 Do family serine endopeptidase [Candidatus Cloacimonadota bacterium]MDD4676217.1 Do family serine endopeptidase [Candidatus Cloacimonadota bacterium]HNZ32640.1 Do family serine endopeptidase [Candidatus Cloacimonas sp.]
MKMWRQLVLVLIALLMTSCASAKDNMIDPNGPNPVVEVVNNVREAVVQIRVEAKVTVQNYINPFLDDPWFRQFFRFPQEQTRPIVSLGSGFIYEYNPGSREAFILTNNHVVEKGRDGTITVTMADKVVYNASIVGLDPSTDVAVIKIVVKEGEKVTVAPLGDSDKLQIGEWAIAIGNPFSEGLDRTVTLGVISATSRSNLNLGDNSPIYQDFIQTDAAINSGNSGGPLLNIKGEVIGINSALASTNGGNVGIGFAIPINLAKRVVEDLVASGKVTRAYIGILPQEITPDIMEAFGLKEVAGVLVAKVEKDSPADKAGIKTGDIIIEINGEKVPSVPKFRIAIATARVGQQIPLKIVRDKKDMTIRVTLEAYPEDIAAASDSVKGGIATGISVEAIDSQTAKRLGVTSDKGVVVTKVDPNSPAAKSGLKVGYVILQIEDKEVNSPKEFNTELEKAKTNMEKENRKTIRLYVLDTNKQPRFIVLKFE